VDDFVVQCNTLNFDGDKSLEKAKNLWMSRPVSCVSSAGSKVGELFIDSLRVMELEDLIRDAEEIEKEANSVMNEVNDLDEYNWIYSVERIYDKLKDILENVTSRRSNTGELTLTVSLHVEQGLNRCGRIIGWLVRF
jgi:hypothetical protein